MRVIGISIYLFLLINVSQAQQLSTVDSVVVNQLKNAEEIRQNGNSLFLKRNYEEALNKYNEALLLFEEYGDSTGIAKCYNNIGTSQLFLSNNEAAIKAFYTAIEINKSLHNQQYLSSNYINLATYYAKQKEFSLAYEYYNLARSILIELDENHVRLPLVYIGLGDVLGKENFENHNYDSAVYYYKKAIDQYSLRSDSANMALTYNNIGVLLADNKQLDSALINYNKSFKIKEALKDNRGEITTLLNIGNVYMNQGNYGIALDYYTKGVDFALKFDDKINYLHLITNIIKCKIRVGEPEEVDSLFVIYNNLNDSIYNEAKMKSLKELEVLYETEKTGRALEDQIRQTKAQTKLSYWFLSIAVAVVIVSAIIILFLAQRQRFRQKLRDQELERIRKDQEIKELNAMMQGQEEERNRIAEDLHDRLGARLSAIKLLSEQEKNGNTQKLTEMLEASIRETREISHNLSTDMLTRFGLANAIRDLVNTVNSSNAIEGDFTTTNLEDRLPVELERPLFHMISELVNNTIKHAKASSFFIQLTRDDDENVLSLLYEDDGQGFDLESVAKNGMGMKNLRARVEGLNGELTIDTSPGKGLNVMAHIPMTLVK